MEPIKPVQPPVSQPIVPPTEPPKPTLPEPRPSFSPESNTQHNLHNKKGLAGLLVVSLVLLLAGASVGGWLIWQKMQNGNKGPTVVFNPDDISDVSSVSFVPPATPPAGYVRRDENTHAEQVSLYSNVFTNCAIATRVVPLSSGTAKDAVLKQADATPGITTTSNAVGDDYKIPDTDSRHEYKFASLNLEQNVNVVGIGYTKQYATVLYKPFNAQVASITVSCRSDTWDGQKPALIEAAKQFKVKSER